MALDFILHANNMKYVNIILYYYLYYIIMASKTTVAVDQKLRKKIKKLSALMDKTQSAVIEKAIARLEKDLFCNKKQDKTIIENGNIDVSKILEEATQEIWKKYPELEKNQKILQKGSQTIDDFLLNDWITGLDD